MAQSAKPSDPASKRGNMIKIGIIVACLAGAVVGYTMMSSDAPPPKTPETQEAEVKAEEIQRAVEKQTPAEPPPPEIQRQPAGRAVKAPGT